MIDRDAGGKSGSTLVLLIGIAFVSFNLRPAIVSVAPLLDVIRVDLGLSSAVVSLLTAVPVVLIGVFALSAPIVVSRVGHEGGVLLGVVLIGIGTLARLGGLNLSILLATTLIVGIGIGITQALLPAIVKAYFPSRIAFATGLYTVGLTVGATLASGMTVPLSRFFDSWPTALAAWSIVAVAGVLAWIPIKRSGSEDRFRSATRRSLPGSGRLWRNPMVWALTLFYIFNTSVYYSLLTWLPPRFVGLGWSETAAGLLLTVFIVAGLAGMLLIMAVGDRSADRRVWLVPTLSLALVGIVGLTVAPERAPWFWVSSLGFGIGAWFTIMLMLPVDYAADSEATGKLSAVAIGGGYIVGGAAPFSVGVLRDLYGEFTIAFGVLVAFVALALAMSVLFRPTDEPSIGA